MPVLTLAEYQSMSVGGRIGYRLFRNPLVMFGIGPIYSMILQPRWASRNTKAKIQRSTWRTNSSIVLAVFGMCWLVGWQNFLLVEVPIVLLAGSAGLWLFYVQHHFEQAYWERTKDWNYADAALRGSSYLRLPKILQFFSGNIGLHHAHHLNPRVPNYNLQRAHDEVECSAACRRCRCGRAARVRLKLWDEKGDRWVTWADVRRLRLVPVPTR